MDQEIGRDRRSIYSAVFSRWWHRCGESAIDAPVEEAIICSTRLQWARYGFSLHCPEPVEVDCLQISHSPSLQDRKHGTPPCSQYDRMWNFVRRTSLYAAPFVIDVTFSLLQSRYERLRPTRIESLMSRFARGIEPRSRAQCKLIARVRCLDSD